MKSKRCSTKCKVLATVVELLEYTKREGRPPYHYDKIRRRIKYYFNRSPYDFLVELSLKGIINEKLEFTKGDIKVENRLEKRLISTSSEQKRTLRTNLGEFIRFYFFVKGWSSERDNLNDYLKYPKKHELTNEDFENICRNIEMKKAGVRLC